MDEQKMRRALKKITDSRGVIKVLVGHGGAPGADSLAEWICHDMGIHSFICRARWKKYGRKAGPMRNRVLSREFDPHVVLAFGGDRGTADSVELATKAGKKVYRFS